MTEETHLSPEIAASYRARKLQPVEVAAVARHLGTCTECQAVVLRAGDAERLAEALDGEASHLDYDELEDQVEGRAPVHPHLAECPMCAAEFDDLKGFRDSLASDRQRKQQQKLRWGAAVAVAAAVLAGVYFGVPRQWKESGASTGSGEAAPRDVASSLNDVALNDVAGIVAADGNGGLRGLEGADPAAKQLALRVLKTGELPEARNNSNLIRSREILLGPAPAADRGLEPAAPVGTVVGDAQPIFKWKAPAGANSFIVSIYTTDFVPVATSPALGAQEWKANTPLKAGATYLWTVSGIVAGTRITAPRAPEPEARFRVASEAEQRQMEAARQVRPGSDLLVAATAAELGMVDEAGQALGRLAARNPGSPLIASLERSLDERHTGQNR